ncbi:2'-5' RNA ligase family protein [Micromonospora endolithica]|uniref:2'-5' RNA ligase family protein n=1 Tax=Micromonospora endolithica TaxID=230091 RepID=A0A3A9YX90_9ACTN|nr:2'-5' RNA ligase family protein [Micromonospora endolithica]RKN40648.1 2'-5' RNA ligase family protein [Micromonospora endolithica]TWJ21739.1 2'-5' RNA ligase superfamily protein [Micromonospora endolithica]
MRTVELVCSPELDAAVRAGWQRLAAAGLPSLARNTHPTNRPHLTLAAVDDFPPGAAARLGALFAEVLPLPVRLDDIQVLDGSAPLVWSIHPDASLTALHAAVWDVLRDADGHHPWHAPGRWRPHLSLALRFRDADAALARAVLGPQGPAGSFVAGRSYHSADRSVTPLG